MLGKLLVAPPMQRSEYWAESVIFIYEENYNNTVGLIVNKPSDKTLKELAEHHGFDYHGDELLYVGGPINASALVMLHTDDWMCSNTMQIENSNFRISSDRSMLRRICEGDRPAYWRLFLGMSAWTPDQLQSEIAGNFAGGKKAAWLTANANRDVLFSKKPIRAWNMAIDAAAESMVQSYFHIE